METAGRVGEGHRERAGVSPGCGLGDGVYDTETAGRAGEGHQEALLQRPGDGKGRRGGRSWGWQRRVGRRSGAVASRG